MKSTAGRIRWVLATVLAVATLVTACGNAGGQSSARAGASSTVAPSSAPSSTAPPTTAPPLPVDRPTGVGVLAETFVDPSRPTSPNGSFAGAPDRTFPVTVWYPADGDPAAPALPDAPPERRGGPYPLVLFAHGYAVTPSSYEELLRRWASAGYVVAAPTYPILSGIPGGPGHADYELSFADTTFVLTQLLDMVDDVPGTSPLAGLVDPRRVAAAGHSDGEVIAFGVGFLVCCRDPRVKAVIAMAGDLANIANPVERDNGVPILHVLGEDDEFDPYPHAMAWDRDNLTAPKWSLTLVGGSHAPPYGDPSSPYFDGIVTMTVDFLDGTLKDRPDRLLGIDDYVAAHPELFRVDR